MTYKAIKETIDAYPGSTSFERQQMFAAEGLKNSEPFERHVAFVESLWGPISDAMYRELMKIHLSKEL